MRYDDAIKLIGNLSEPSKMPWYGWSISAKTCQLGGELAKVEGTTCHGCYALKGRYNFPNVQNAMGRRAEGADHPDFVEAFVTVLSALRRRQRIPENRFRWFDSGDIQSLEMLEKINEIARLTPDIRHWLPTREVRYLKAFLIKHGAFSPNLQIRVSYAWIGKAPSNPIVKGVPMSTVDVPGGHQCPAPKQGGQCLSCDACWTTKDVNYDRH